MSEIGAGDVIFQKGKNPEERWIIAYVCKKFCETQKRYAAVERECLAIIDGAESVYHFLLPLTTWQSEDPEIRAILGEITSDSPKSNPEKLTEPNSIAYLISEGLLREYVEYYIPVVISRLKIQFDFVTTIHWLSPPGMKRNLPCDPPTVFLERGEKRRETQRQVASRLRVHETVKFTLRKSNEL